MNDWGTFNPQPVLTGDTVALRPLHAKDWDMLFGVASDPLIWAAHPAHDRWQESVYRRYFDDGLASGGGLVITDRSNGAIIGQSRFDRTRVEPGEIEVGWTFLARAHWGGTTNYAVKSLMIAHALLSFDTVVFYVGETNGRSRRALEKIGALLLPDRRIEFEMAGVPTSHVVYAIRQPLP